MILGPNAGRFDPGQPPAGHRPAVDGRDTGGEHTAYSRMLARHPHV